MSLFFYSALGPCSMVVISFYRSGIIKLKRQTVTAYNQFSVPRGEQVEKTNCVCSCIGALYSSLWHPVKAGKQNRKVQAMRRMN